MRVLTIILMLGISLLTFAQVQETYVTIVDAIQHGDVDGATTMLQKQIKKDKRESEWYKLLDDTYKYSDNVEGRIELLTKAVKVKKVKEPELLQFRLAAALFDAGRYDECVRILDSLPQKKQVRSFKEKCISAKELRSHPVECDITLMGDSINTPYDNIWPFINNDKSLFYTTVVVGKSTVKEKSAAIQEDIFCSSFNDSVWLPVTALQGALHSTENEGACSVTADGRYIFFAACNRRDGGGGCEIYYSTRQGEVWGKPVRADAPLNGFSWQSTPSISSDGVMLYFSAVDDSDSKVKNVHQRQQTPHKDIYSCIVTYNADGTLSFSEVQKLGPEINTIYDEISPFISPYGDILYFSSEGRGGMGGLDVYYSRRRPDGTWSEALNIGYPINTHRDEFGFVTDVDCSNGYMACNGVEGGEFWQNKRIVKISLAEEMRSNAPFERKNGGFILENVYFDTDSSSLRAESSAYLDRLAEYLIIHPSYSITISGHTDSTGIEGHNVSLSKARAVSVAVYLNSKGIDAARITTEGYGSSRPLQSNDTEEGRAANRRIEVQIVVKN